MSTTPNFASTPRFSAATINTANTGRAGQGTLGSVFVAGNNGSRVDWIRAWAITPVTPGVIRYFVSGGGNNYLLQETAVPPTTPTTSGANWSFDFYPATALLLQSGYILQAGTQNAEEFDINAFGGDF